MAEAIIDMMGKPYQKRAKALLKRLEGHLEIEDWSLNAVVKSTAISSKAGKKRKSKRKRAATRTKASKG